MYSRNTKCQNTLDLCILNTLETTFANVKGKVKTLFTLKHIEVSYAIFSAIIKFCILWKKQVSFFFYISQHGSKHDCVFLMLRVEPISIWRPIVVRLDFSCELASNELSSVLLVQQCFWVFWLLQCNLSIF